MKDHPACKDCSGTGLIETETIIFSRYKYIKEYGCFSYECIGKGDWKMTQCPCVGEYE